MHTCCSVSAAARMERPPRISLHIRELFRRERAACRASIPARASSSCASVCSAHRRPSAAAAPLSKQADKAGRAVPSRDRTATTLMPSKQKWQPSTIWPACLASILAAAQLLDWQGAA